MSKHDRDQTDLEQKYKSEILDLKSHYKAQITDLKEKLKSEEIKNQWITKDMRTEIKHLQDKQQVSQKQHSK